MGILNKKDKEPDIAANITALLRATAWAEPMMRLHKQLTDGTAVASHLKGIVKQRDVESKVLDVIRADVKTLTEQRATLQRQAKDQQAAMVHMKEKAVEDIETQRKEAHTTASAKKKDAEATVSEMYAKVSAMNVAALRKQDTAEREHRAWREQADREMAEAERELSGLKRAATEMKNKVAALAS